MRKCAAFCHFVRAFGSPRLRSRSALDLVKKMSSSSPPPPPQSDTPLPGGSERHGNFKTYYKFNPAEARTKLLPASLLQDCFPDHPHNEIVGLDVGCNSGVSD